MTAPAEDPRSGEACGEALCTTTTLHHTHTDADGRSWCCGDNPYGPPAAGRGDSGDVQRQLDTVLTIFRCPICGARNSAARSDVEAGLARCADHGVYRPAARSAGDRAQPTQDEQSVDLTPGVVWTDAQLAVVRDLTARAVRAEAAVDRVEALATEYRERAEKVADGFWKRHLSMVALRLRRALDGTT